MREYQKPLGHWWPTGVCRCKGEPKAKRAHWGVLARGSGRKAHIKCKRCHCRWWSMRKYTADLPDHRERSLSGLTDADILERLRLGTLIVNIRTAVVRNDKGHRLLVTPRTSPTSGTTYNFLTIYFRGKAKKIARHRLVWMAAHNCLVPVGYDVDHVRGKRGRYPDGIGNLELCVSRDNQADNGTRYDEDF